nr:MAG TPA_asm: Pancreatic hormone peptide [Caudoviricetes sp.]DAW58148.1 MAG TPA: Pancreatic hormone peptide [Caudoviricetes sp.]
MSPKDVMDLTPEELRQYAEQWNRIQEELNHGG